MGPLTEHDRARLVGQLKRDEGTRPYVYTDTTGHLTVAHGHNLETMPLSPSAMDQILDDDLGTITAGLLHRLPWANGLDGPRLAVLLNMAFNLGISGLMEKNPKMLAACQAGAFATAATEMLDGPWKDQVHQRADRLAEQMRSGEWI